MSRKVLYVGMDESNHGDTKSKIGEIIVATCSYNEKFWKNRKHPEKKDYTVRVRDWLETGTEFLDGVYYLYTLLPHEIARENISNLPRVAPFFVKSFLASRNVSKVKLGLDGKLLKPAEEELMKIFAREEIDIEIEDFPKRNGVHYGPELVYLSHVIANNLIQRLLGFAADSHYTPFNALNM